MDKTLNYNLKKPAQNDFFDVGVFSENFDIIDSEIKKASEKNLPPEHTVLVIDKSQTITLPEHVKFIDIMIVDGGAGGTGGTGGIRYQTGNATSGKGGDAGKIINFSNLAVNGKLIIKTGVGGTGGAGGKGSGTTSIPNSELTGTAGTGGTPTTVTNNNTVFSTANFSNTVNTIIPVFCPYNVQFYGKNGTAGGSQVNKYYGDGGDGGIGGIESSNGSKGYNGMGGCVIIHYIGGNS